MDLDEYFASNPMGGIAPSALGDSALSPHFKSGFVALIGRPNAGKSTLMNRIAGRKVAITSKTSQTTRKRVRAISTTDDYQLILVDTPGLHKPKDVLGEELNATAMDALADVDVAAVVIDASAPIGRGDKWVAERLANTASAKICVLSKNDLASPEQIAAQRIAAEQLMDWDAMVSLSSRTGHNVNAFVEEAVHFLPEGPLWFPPHMDTDVTEEEMVAEFIREKVLQDFRDEIPHSVGVCVETMDYVRKKGLYRISATIYTERESQKAILVGRGGKAVKRIGTRARADLETLLGARVFLELFVKVKKNWRSDEAQLRRFGYME